MITLLNDNGPCHLPRYWYGTILSSNNDTRFLGIYLAPPAIWLWLWLCRVDLVGLGGLFEMGISANPLLGLLLAQIKNQPNINSSDAPCCRYYCHICLLGDQ